MDWMTQGALVLPSVLQNILRQVEKLLMKYDPDKTVKVKDHLDNFYLHLQTLEVGYDDFACRIFPCTLDGRAAVWYHILLVNSIQNSGMFKIFYLENFVMTKSPSCC